MSARVGRGLADITSVMMMRPLPAAFNHLMANRNPSVDIALSVALVDMEPFAQAVALELLTKRAHPASLGRLVSGFRQSRGVLRELILAHAASMSPGIQAAIGSSSPTDKLSAIELIVRGNALSLAYLLAGTLRGGTRRTREEAATAMKMLTQQWLKAVHAETSPEKMIELNNAVRHLTDALTEAVQRWELHHQPAVLEAVLWMGDRMGASLRTKLDEPHSKLSHALGNLLEDTSDPRLAGATLRALGDDSLRSAAVKVITKIQDASFWEALIEQHWLITDHSIQKGLRHVQVGPWLESVIPMVFDLSDRQVEGAVRFFFSLGGTPERRMEYLRPLIESDHEIVRRATLWELFKEEHEVVDNLLRNIALRSKDHLAVLAHREIRRRQRREGKVTEIQNRDSASVDPFVSDMDSCWQALSSGPHAYQASMETLRKVDQEPLIRWLKKKCASTEPFDRVRTLQLLDDLGLTVTMGDTIHRMAMDSSPVVRAAAVAMLVKLPGPTTERILRSAANDQDSRTQANALEVMDLLDIQSRQSVTKPHLESRSARVRANAVRSLLRTEMAEAVTTLLDMLGDPSPAHRISALFVLEHAPSQAMLDKVSHLVRKDPDRRVRQRAMRVLRQMAQLDSAMVVSRDHPMPSSTSGLGGGRLS